MTEIPVTGIDLSHLDSLEDLKSFRPADHPAVKELDEQISNLKSERSEQRQNSRTVEEAESNLEEVKRKAKLGEATEADVEEARDELDTAKARTEDESPILGAIEELKERRRRTIAGVKKAYRDRCRDCYEHLITEAIEPARQLLQLREQLEELKSAIKRRGDGSELTLKAHAESGPGASKSMPPFPLPSESEQPDDPTRRRPPLRAVKWWLRKHGDPSDWKRGQ